MEPGPWIDVGAAHELRQKTVQQVLLGRRKIALVYKDERFSAISSVCNHVGGPLGDGTLDGDYVVCPWHYWKFHCRTGDGEPGYEERPGPGARGARSRTGVCWCDSTPQLEARRLPTPAASAAARTPQREAGPMRVLGISTTAMDGAHPRYSTSDDLLDARARTTRPQARLRDALIRSRELKFRHCEGYYSKSARACTWPCSITQMDAERPDGARLRGRRALGGRDPGGDTDPLGRGKRRCTTRWSSG